MLMGCLLGLHVHFFGWLYTNKSSTFFEICVSHLCQCVILISYYQFISCNCNFSFVSKPGVTPIYWKVPYVRLLRPPFSSHSSTTQKIALSPKNLRHICFVLLFLFCFVFVFCFWFCFCFWFVLFCFVF